jgi:hypothetical protein
MILILILFVFINCIEFNFKEHKVNLNLNEQNFNEIHDSEIVIEGRWDDGHNHTERMIFTTNLLRSKPDKRKKIILLSLLESKFGNKIVLVRPTIEDKYFLPTYEIDGDESFETTLIKKIHGINVPKISSPVITIVNNDISEEFVYVVYKMMFDDIVSGNLSLFKSEILIMYKETILYNIVDITKKIRDEQDKNICDDHLKLLKRIYK